MGGRKRKEEVVQACHSLWLAIQIATLSNWHFSFSAEIGVEVVLEFTFNFLLLCLSKISSSQLFLLYTVCDKRANRSR